MKTKIFVLIITLAVCSLQANAQAPIVRQNGSSSNFYTTVPTAVEAANSGDTIYIPGGSWSIGNMHINKTLHIFGTGHNPDSSQASGFCYLTGSILLESGSRNGSLWGLYISGTISCSNSTDTITNYTIRRCRIAGDVTLSSNFSLGLIAENVFDNGIHGLANNNDFISNIIYCINSLGPSNVFRNNLFINNFPCGFATGNCLFENNIFLDNYNPLANVGNSIFNNNLFVYNYNFPAGTNLGSNNIVNQARSSIMVNQSGGQYSYSENYHVLSTSPGHNGGIDGTDVGVYGGMFPWKEGSIPPNPHIQLKNISQTTDQNGSLQINIKIKAQDH